LLPRDYEALPDEDFRNRRRPRKRLRDNFRQAMNRGSIPQHDLQKTIACTAALEIVLGGRQPFRSLHELPYTEFRTSHHADGGIRLGRDRADWASKHEIELLRQPDQTRFHYKSDTTELVLQSLCHENAGIWFSAWIKTLLALLCEQQESTVFQMAVMNEIEMAKCIRRR